MSHNVSPHLARARALEAAEKRKRLGEVMGDGGGRRLGGTLPAWSGQSPQELAVMVRETPSYIYIMLTLLTSGC